MLESFHFILYVLHFLTSNCFSDWHKQRVKRWAGPDVPERDLTGVPAREHRHRPPAHHHHLHPSLPGQP